MQNLGLHFLPCCPSLSFLTVMLIAAFAFRETCLLIDSFALTAPCSNQVSVLRFIRFVCFCSVLPSEISFSSHKSNNALKGIFCPESRFFFLNSRVSSEYLVHHSAKNERSHEYSFYPADNEKPLRATLKICVLYRSLWRLCSRNE